MAWALLNNVNYAILAAATFGFYKLGWLKLYFDWQEYGTLYGLFIIPVLLLAHDAYFFWVHYLMHRTPFRRVSHHWVHHQFHNVTPWSAFSVHPIEGFVELFVPPHTSHADTHASIHLDHVCDSIVWIEHYWAFRI